MAENLNSGLSYLITTVFDITELRILWVNSSAERWRHKTVILIQIYTSINKVKYVSET